jgi:hypothetical protein
MAEQVVAAEMKRLDARVPGLDDHERDEVQRTMRRIADKLLHTPTVRVKQRAGEPGGGAYAEVLRELFDLDLETISAVSSVGVLAPVGAVDSTTAMNATVMTGTTMTTTGPVPGPAPGGTS